MCNKTLTMSSVTALMTPHNTEGAFLYKKAEKRGMEKKRFFQLEPFPAGDMAGAAMGATCQFVYYTGVPPADRKGAIAICTVFGAVCQDCHCYPKARCSGFDRSNFTEGVLLGLYSRSVVGVVLEECCWGCTRGVLLGLYSRSVVGMHVCCST
jgi:hypothetical protein